MTNNLEDKKELFQLKEDSLNGIVRIIEEVYGPRCARNEGGCLTCTAWSIYDTLERLLDSSTIKTIETNEHTLKERNTKKNK